MGYWGYYPRYVSVAEKKARAAAQMAKLKKKNPDISPVVITGSAIAKTWWGKSWNINLERYADYSNRIGRGRSYVRHGAVLDLQILPGEIRSLVQGSTSKPYEVSIKIKGIEKKIWNTIQKKCQGQLDSMSELIEGRFPKALKEIFMEKGAGLFPAPDEIGLYCSCPDWASMCKHVAATLYGIGARLDADPMLFFTLRQVNVDDLITAALTDKTRQLLDKTEQKSDRVMEGADLSDVFGIDLDGGSEPSSAGKPDEKQEKKQTRSVKKAAGDQVKKQTEKMEKPKPAIRKAKPIRRKIREKPIEKTADTPVKKRIAARKSTTPKAPEPPVKKRTPSQKKALSATDRIRLEIGLNRKGVNIPALMEKTGFDEKKVYNILYRLQNQGEIIRTIKGFYKKA